MEELPWGIGVGKGEEFLRSVGMGRQVGGRSGDQQVEELFSEEPGNSILWQGKVCAGEGESAWEIGTPVEEGAGDEGME